MPNPYVNKVAQSNGTILIDISDTTAVAADVASGKYFYLATGEKVQGASEGGGGGPTYETIVPEQTINCTIDLSNGAYGGYISNYTEYTSEGQKYRVYYDGAEYGPLTATYYGDGTTYLYVGDINVMLSSSATLTYPFVIMLYNGSVFYLAVRGSGSHTLQVDKMTSEGSGGGGTLRGKTCVCLGDSVTALMAPPNDYPSVLASNTGMTVINGGFEGCRMSDTHPSATYAAFSAVKLADAIATGIWTTQDANIGGFESGSYAPAHLTALKAVNWSNVDYITVEFGGNDAGDQYVYIDNTQNPTDTTTYVGAARYAYNRIHAAYPNIKIMFFVPMYRYWISEGKDSDEMTFTLGGNTYHYYDWGDALIASPPASGVPVIDMYRTLGINASNRTTYLLTSDQTHPSVAGCELIAQKFETELYNHFISGGSSATLIAKTITENGTYNASSDSADGYSSVTVNVPTPAAVAMNVQTQQSTSRRNNTALGSVTSLTCEAAGTYDVYWTCARSSTSGTWGSQLYINGTAYGSENTTFNNNVQNNHLTGVTIPANATVAVYGRSRSGYYIYVPQLTIQQTA